MTTERIKKIVTGLILFAVAYIGANEAGAFDGTPFHLSASVVKELGVAGMVAGLFCKSVLGLEIPFLGITMPGATTKPIDKATGELAGPPTPAVGHGDGRV
jgi:hypothetical protein